MSGPFPKFTAGGIGNAATGKMLTFDHVNRITDATEKVESMPEVGPSKVRGTLRTFWAELVAEAGTDIGSNVSWSWEEVGVNSAGNAVANQTGQMTSAMFPTGQGDAIALNGATGSAGSVVLMHELVGFDGVRRFAFTVGSGGRMEQTWAILNATQSAGTITTGVAPTDLGNGIFEYKAVPIKFSAYAAGAFTYAVDDDPRFEPTVYGGTSITLLNAPTHQNDADWKYAGVLTSAGSDYPAGFDVRGIGEKRDTAGGASTWISMPVQVARYDVGGGSYIWLLMAEPDHDGSCTGSAASEFAPAFWGGS